MVTLGERIRWAREFSGFTQENFAEVVGVSRTAVTKWESNQTEPTVGNLILIAQTLHISADFLLGIPTGGRENFFADLSEEAVLLLQRFVTEIHKG